jgi:hypothetical protein
MLNVAVFTMGGGGTSVNGSVTSGDYVLAFTYSFMGF